MNAKANVTDEHASPRPLRIAVVGGGFTGVAFIIHTILATRPAAGTTSAARLHFDLVERSAEIGRGVAYGTRDPLHRINVPSDRMSLLGDDPTHATRWLVTHGKLKPGDTDANGHHYVSREDYGAYVDATLRDTVTAEGNRVHLTRWHAEATSVHLDGAARTVTLDTGASIQADRVALCMGHATPVLPCDVPDSVLQDPRFVQNPWLPGVLEHIASHRSVLIVGTGLTMADCLASLLARGHRGAITAISRRGLLPQPHGVFWSAADFLGDAPAPTSVRALLKMLRARIARDKDPYGWQPAVDALRFDLPRIWPALPKKEQRRVVRRLLPFWDVHRFRIAPQVHDVIHAAISKRNVIVERAGMTAIVAAHDGLRVTLARSLGETERRTFDHVVLCTGPSRDVFANPLLHSLRTEGLARADRAGIGVDVSPISQLIDSEGKVVDGVFVLGPATRGTFGEMTGAPDIARHIERLLKDAKTSILGACSREQTTR